MGFVTMADEKLIAAKEHIDSAAKAISEIVIDNCNGFDDFTPDFRIKLRKLLNDILEIKERL